MSKKGIGLGFRLKDLRNRLDIKMPAIALATGIAKETLYKWEKGTSPGNINDYLTLKAYLDKMENKLEVESYELESRKPATIRIPLKNDRPVVPQTDGKSAAGTVICTNNELELIAERINSPFLGEVEGVVEVIGDSMAPTFKNGCRIVIKRLKDSRILNWGDCYFLVDSNLHGTVKRISSGISAGCITLVSDNADQVKFPPIEKSMDQIEAIFKVVASITKH